MITINGENELQINELTPSDMGKTLNEYMGNTNITDSFTTQMFNEGITSTVNVKDLKQWLSNPEEHQKELENLAMYYYITNSSVFQLYDLAEVLPTLNYKTLVEDKDADYEANRTSIKKALKKTKHKQLTRDLITQTIASGTLCGMWIGGKKNPYLFVFNDLEYVFPAYIKNGEWVLWLDLSWLDKMTDFQREFMIENLSPHVTKADYQAYKDNPQDVRYMDLPLEYTVCLKTHTLYRNQRLGLPWGTQSFLDNIHKEKLKDLEKSISNKVINSVAVLKIGNEYYKDADIPAGKKSKTYRGVKTALQKNNADGVTVIGIPDWTDLDFPTIKTDGLDPKKFESINDDLNTASNGVMNIINGKSNYSTGKLSMDIMYRKIAVLLEQIEDQVYQKLINTILKKKDKDNYSIEYDKHAPLTSKEQLDILEKLNGSFGFSLKAVIDRVDGVDFEQYVADSLYEQEELQLKTKITPYMSSYTSTGDNASGAPVVDDVANPSTEATKTGDGNNNPKPSTS